MVHERVRTESAKYPSYPPIPESYVPRRFQRLEVLIRLEEGPDCERVEKAERKDEEDDRRV